MKTLYIISLSFLLVGCIDQNNYWDISKFKFDDNALQNNEEIKIIYASQSPDSNEDLKYYLHYVVVSQRTKDTVNILSTANFTLEKSDGDKVFHFFDKNNIGSKITMLDINKLRNLSNDDLKNLDNNIPKEIKYVIRNPQYDFITDNSYPTVIGSFGIVKNNKK